MTEKTYGPFELLAAHKEAVPDTFVVRRRIAAAMQALSEKLIRIDAEDSELADWAQSLEQLVERVGERSQRDSRSANRRMFTGQATAADIFDMMDYDPMGGLSNPIAPQLAWGDEGPDGVHATIRLGQHYQGPPGRVHGGVLAWIMDAVLSRAMHASMKLGVTGTLSLRYMAATPIDTVLRCEGKLTRMDGRKMFIEGAIFNGEEQTVQAEGIFFMPNFGKKKS